MAANNLEAIKGIDLVVLMRPLNVEETESATILAFQTDGELSESADSDSVVTKDRNLQLGAKIETEGSVSSIKARNDKKEEAIHDAFKDGEKFGFWFMDRGSKGEGENEGKRWTTYYEGIITDRSISFSAEDFTELEYEYALEGTGVRGWATLSEEQEAVVGYIFKDTTPLGSAPTEPEPTEPTPIEPEPTEPTPTEPEPTEPETTYPTPSEPSPIDYETTI